MTREEFEDWLEEHREDALDSAQQSDTSKLNWISRLYASLKATAKAEDSEEIEDEAGDLFEETEDDDDDEEEEEDDDEEES